MSRTIKRKKRRKRNWWREAKTETLCADFGVVRVFLFNVDGRRPATLNRKTWFDPKSGLRFWGSGLFGGSGLLGGSGLFFWGLGLFGVV